MSRFPAHSLRPDKAEQFTLIQSKNPWNPVSVTLPQTKTSSLNPSPPTAARGAAGVTPAPGVHSIQAQNPADGTLLSGRGDPCTQYLLQNPFEKIRCTSAATSEPLRPLSAGVTPAAAHRAGNLTDLATAIRFGSNIPFGLYFTARPIDTADSVVVPRQPFTSEVLVMAE